MSWCCLDSYRKCLFLLLLLRCSRHQPRKSYCWTHLIISRCHRFRRCLQHWVRRINLLSLFRSWWSHKLWKVEGNRYLDDICWEIPNKWRNNLCSKWIYADLLFLPLLRARVYHFLKTIRIPFLILRWKLIGLLWYLRCTWTVRRHCRYFAFEILCFS